MSCDNWMRLTSTQYCILSNFRRLCAGSEFDEPDNILTRLCINTFDRTLSWLKEIVKSEIRGMAGKIESEGSARHE